MFDGCLVTKINATKYLETKMAMYGNTRTIYGSIR